MAEYLLLVGMSGAGRSTAAATLEDRGWFVIDNLPPTLLGKVAELANQPTGEYQRICLVAGRGGYEGLADLQPAVDDLRATGARVRVLFLDASDEALVRRFEGSRRRHPVDVAEGGVLESIRQERDMLRGLRDDADDVIDTTEMNVHQLRDRVIEVIERGSGGALETAVISFGFKHGLPLDADMVLDCRFLPNPHWVPDLRPLTGLDEEVKKYVLSSEEATQLLEKIDSLFLLVLPAYAREGKSYLSIAIGCTGGRHRSVVIAEEIADLIRRHGFRPTVHHRDIDR